LNDDVEWGDSQSFLESYTFIVPWRTSKSLNSTKATAEKEILVHLCFFAFSAYHGHLTTMIDISPYKFNQPNGTGKKDWVHVVKYSKYNLVNCY